MEAERLHSAQIVDQVRESSLPLQLFRASGKNGVQKHFFRLRSATLFDDRRIGIEIISPTVDNRFVAGFEPDVIPS